MSLKWKTISSRTDYSFQCPITRNNIMITEYKETYGPFLETLDGQDLSSYVDFFFQRSPIRNDLWEFIDDDAQSDFLELCQDMGLLPEMSKIHDGTYFDDKNKQPNKQHNNNQPNKQLNQPKKKTEVSDLEKREKIRQSRLETIAKLEEQLAKAKDGEAKTRLEQKIAKIRSQIENN